MTRRELLPRLATAIAIALLIVCFYPHRSASRFIYEQGRPWNYAKLIAPFDIPIHPDSATLRSARDTLDRYFVPVYEINQLLIDSIVRQMPYDAGSGMRDRLAHQLRRLYNHGVVDGDTRKRITAGELPKVRILEKNVLSEMSTSEFISPIDIYRTLDSTITDPLLHSYFRSLDVATLLRPNVVYNATESQRHYDYDYLTITADRGVIQQGQTIVDKGTVLTAQDFTNLQTYEQMLDERLTKESRSNWLMLLGQLLYVALLLGSLLTFLYFNAPAVVRNLRSVVFVLSMIALFFLFAVGACNLGPVWIYIVPMAIVPVLLVVFVDSRTAVFSATVLTLICAPIASYPMEFIFLQFCAASAAVFSLRELNRRSQLLRTAMFVALAYIVAYASLELLLNGTFEGMSWRMPIALMINALLVSMAYILMLVVERVFGFTSEVTLVELADINHPLLRRLSDECPGTFQHSMAVSNLAADAAQRVGADVTLVRTGALYHDIGKLVNPAFFTENQHGVNPHDTLPPEKSAEIVIRHISDGVRQAEKAGLPEVIKDFIREHHGKGKARYFFYNYSKMHPGETVDEAVFTYPGPNPRSRETSILMMADAVEAASRSLTDHSHAAITELVNRIVDSQLAEGLHRDSTLEYRDVPVIKEAFIKRLSTIYHSRVAYPSGAVGGKTEKAD